MLDGIFQAFNQVGICEISGGACHGITRHNFGFRRNTDQAAVAGFHSNNTRTVRTVRGTVGCLTVNIIIIELGVVTVVAVSVIPKAVFNFIVGEIQTVINHAHECALAEVFIFLPGIG